MTRRNARRNLSDIQGVNSIGGHVGRARRSDEATCRARRPVADRGATFVELLVAIVLLGTSVIATLVALQVTTTASVNDAKHARAFILLHEASDAVFTAPRLSCLPPNDEATIMAHYESYFSGLTKPDGWEFVNPDITKIEFLNASDTTGSTVYSWGPLCFEGPVDADGSGTIDPDEDFTDTPLNSQKITIEVISPDGNLVKILETVKR